MSARRRAAWGFCALLALAGAARAQDPPPAAGTEAAPAPAAAEEAQLPVKVEVAPGYAGKVPEQGFVPVVVDLDPGSAAFTVTVTLQSLEASHVLLRLGPVELPAGQRRRLHGVAPADALKDAGELQVTVEGPAGELLGRTTLEPEAVAARMLLVLDRRGAPPADFSSLRTRESAANQPGSTVETRWTAAVIADDEDLPQSPLGWTGAGAVLLGELDVSSWGEPETRALSAWVQRGGHLLLSVGSRASALRRSLLGRRLGDALKPLRDQEPLRAVPMGDALRELVTSLGLDEAARGGAGAPTSAPAVALLRPEPEDLVLLRDDQGNPLALRRAHGLGQVTLIGADLWADPFLHVPLTAHLVELLLAGGPRHEPRSQLLFGELAAVRQPARVGPAFAVLIVYALLAGPGVYFVLRSKRRGIWLWLVIPCLTAAFTGLVPLYRIALTTGESTLVGVHVVEWRSGAHGAAAQGGAPEPAAQGAAFGPGDEQALETTDVLLFSGSLKHKRLELSGEDAVAFAMIPPRRLQRGTPQLGQVLGSGPQGVGFDLKIALWGARYVSFEHTGAAPPLSGQLLLHGGRGALATLSARWEGDTPLEHGCVIYRGPHGGVFVHTLGRELPPGAEVQEQTEPVLASGFGSGKDLESLILDRLLAGRCADQVERAGRAFLLGSVRTGPRLRALENVTIRQLPTIFLCEIPVRFRDAVPLGLARKQVQLSTVAEVTSTSLERQQVTELRLPAGTAARKLRQLDLRLVSSRARSLARLQLEVWRPDAQRWERVPLEGEDAERGPSAREVHLRFVSPPLTAEQVDPATWLETVDETHTRLRFRQRYQRPRSDPDEAHAVEVDAGVSWEVAGATAPPEDE